ncbi:hypothetical protein HII31_00349 [Pseudocercospora fuligena]|uniref:F-box domain-containing protein n=1 Tax=Pseudocercospora fuligena TaxID=685502 RepID=A0A8H6VNR1_9PEZI|nr:hypothetical protein HII31_00349 [Pseudocercospora fuligena]
MATNENESQADRSIFPFFKLARELRDQIYDECLEDRTMRIRGKFGCRAEHVARVNLLLVSRQFKSEYSESAVEKTKMTITYIPQVVYRSSRRTPPASMRFGLPLASLHVRFVRLNLACYRLLSEPIQLRVHRLCVEDLVRLLPSLRALIIRVSFEGSLGLLPELIGDLNQGAWLKLQALKSLEVYYRPHERSDQTILAEIGERHELVAKLSPATGKVQALAED